MDADAEIIEDLRSQGNWPPAAERLLAEVERLRRGLVTDADWEWISEFIADAASEHVDVDEDTAKEIANDAAHAILSRLQERVTP